MLKKGKKNIGAITSVINLNKLNSKPKKIKLKKNEKIIKTTDSINVANVDPSQYNEESLNKISEMQNIRESIYRSYDLARRKITNEYEKIISSGNFVDVAFLTVQITIKNFEKNLNIEYVEEIINKFFDEIPKILSQGKTVYLTEDLVIEPMTYVDKILPTWKITPNFALLTNAFNWTNIVDRLINQKELSPDAKEIIEDLIFAISINIKNGYCIKISKFIVLQLSNVVSQKIVLFSEDTLIKLNEAYAHYLKQNFKKDVKKYDVVTHFDKTLQNVKDGFYNGDNIVNPDKEFVPKDLSKEITPEESTSMIRVKKVFKNNEEK